MRMSIAALCALVASEGIVQSRYKDSVGVWTIGVGHTAAAGGVNPKTFTGTLTVAQVFDLLYEDIKKYENDVTKAVKVPIKQHQFDALVHWHYNTGAIATATLTKELNKGNYGAAANQFLKWIKNPELKDRRDLEKAMFEGKYPKSTMATVYPASPTGAVQWGKGKRVDVKKMLDVHDPAAQPAILPTPKPEEVAASPAQDGVKPDVVLVDGPKADETTVVVVPTPQNPPATNPMPTSKTGFAVFGAILISIGTAALKYFGG